MTGGPGLVFTGLSMLCNFAVGMFQFTTMGSSLQLTGGGVLCHTCAIRMIPKLALQLPKHQKMHGLLRPPRQNVVQCSVCLQEPKATAFRCYMHRYSCGPSLKDLQATEDLCQTACGCLVGSPLALGPSVTCEGGHEFHRSCLEDSGCRLFK